MMGEFGRLFSLERIPLVLFNICRISKSHLRVEFHHKFNPLLYQILFNLHTGVCCTEEVSN